MVLYCRSFIMTVTTPKIGTIYKIAGFIAFILLSYLGLRSYKISVEKLKINACIEEVGELMNNTIQAYSSQKDYNGYDYSTAVSLKLIPRRMFKVGYREAVNAYMGGVDVFYSSLYEMDDNKSFEISFQGLSSFGCRELMKVAWDEQQGISFIAVGGYKVATPSGVLDEILIDTPQQEIKKSNIFKAQDLAGASEKSIENACQCDENTCSVVWKFK